MHRLVFVEIKHALILFVLLASLAMPAFATIPAAERAVLLNIYANTNGPSWSYRDGWNGAPGTECEWHGISCDANQTTVLQIDLNSNHLSGSLPALSPLTNLQVLDVGQNDLAGSIPALTGLIHLQGFAVYSNRLSGSVPDLSGLTDLQTFHVWNNKLAGTIPNLANLTNLQNFHADRNQLTGTIPQLQGLTNLKYFGVNTNQLTGPIPALDGLVNLNEFDVSYNQLTGSVPTLADLTSLQSLKVSYNNVSGQLPPAPASLVSGRSQLCPNALLQQVNDPAWDNASFVTPWYKDCAAAANLAVIDVNGGSNAMIGTRFPVTVQSQNTNSTATNVANSTAIKILLVKGAGVLSDSNNSFNCIIPAGSNTCVASDLVYSAAESGIQIGAYTLSVSGYLRSIPSLSFTVVAGSFTIGGTVTGLKGKGLTLSLNSDTQTIPISADGTFTFPNALGDGAYYSVSIKTQPNSPAQSCTVDPSYGTVAGRSVSDIRVSCVNVYSVTPSAGANGLIAPPTVQTVALGAITNFEIQPNVGYSANVSGTCGGTLAGQTYTTNPITADCTVIANFSPASFTVTPSAGPNGTISPASPQLIGRGAIASFVITPNTGYQSGVGGSCGGGWASSSGTTYTTIPITADCTVVASFQAVTVLTGVKLTSSVNPSLVGQTVTLTAAVSGNAPNGTITFYDGSTALCNDVQLSSNFSAACSISTLVASFHFIHATYRSSADNSTSTSAVLGQIVNPAPAPSATMLTSFANPSIQNQGVAFEASIVGNSPTGFVTFKDGDSTLSACDRAPIRSVNGKFIAYCAGIFNVAATHAITAGYSGDDANAPSRSEPLAQAVAPAVAFNPDQFGITGSWYNAVTSGQGFEIEVMPDYTGVGKGILFAGWFTYDRDWSGTQRWYTLQGTVDRASATATLGIFQTVDGNFNAPPKVGAMKIGNATLTFADCTHATLQYTFADSSRTGIIPITRLSTPTSCAQSGDNGETGTDFFLSGAWYSAATSGQGIVFDLSPTQTTLFGAWYTYAPGGQSTAGAASQRWFTLQTNTYVPGLRNVTNVPIYAPRDGIFDDPTPITNSRVGNANISFSSCGAMSLQYTFTSGEFAGQSGKIAMTPVGPAPSGCK